LEQLIDDAADEYDPDKQLEQTLEDVEEYKPAAQAPVTAVRPVVAQYEPPGHDVQLDEPAVTWKYPATQLEHTDEDEAENNPAEQLPVTTVRPAVAQ